MYTCFLQFRSSLQALFLAWFLALFFAFAIGGCSKDGSFESQSEPGRSISSGVATEEMAPMDADVPPDGGGMNRADKKSVPTQAVNSVDNLEPAPAPMRIYKGNLQLQVDDLTQAAVVARKLAQKHNAWLDSERQANESYEHSISFRFRVPPKGFEPMLAELEALGIQTTHKEITTEDVGEAYADLTARMKHKKAVAEQYEQLLRRSGTIQDILNVQAELSRVQEEIESTEGRLRYLQRQVSFSTIDLKIYLPVESSFDPRPGFWGQLGSAFKGGWIMFQNLILFFVRGWPVFVPLALLAFWLFYYRRKRRRSALERPAAVSKSSTPRQQKASDADKAE